MIEKILWGIDIYYILGAVLIQKVWLDFLDSDEAKTQKTKYSKGVYYTSTVVLYIYVLSLWPIELPARRRYLKNEKKEKDDG